ncbi:hypothetical protein [Marininema halotolerans]|uniref:Uncharacterized protein n=1 Tax=Marininema halotolerans TaxID=1155944 RepID=A0A1I6UTY6_9BACL|nr:hypothetical protein [Marininema halotolerans]SFT04905.1 hypothetical protein SAMN05444972_1212 [Marininema halotolerans]
MTLLDECLDALGDEVEILSEKKSQEVFDLFESNFCISHGKVDWEKVNGIMLLDSMDELLDHVRNEIVYILWDNANKPVLKANLGKVIDVIDDVTAVSFDTWLLSVDLSYLVEYYHEGDVTIGLFDKPNKQD